MGPGTPGRRGRHPSGAYWPGPACVVRAGDPLPRAAARDVQIPVQRYLRGGHAVDGIHDTQPYGYANMRYWFLAVSVMAAYGAGARAQWQQQTLATKADFRGLCVVSPKCVWASGTKGTFVRTIDG